MLLSERLSSVSFSKISGPYLLPLQPSKAVQTVLPSSRDVIHELSLHFFTMILCACACCVSLRVAPILNKLSRRPCCPHSCPLHPLFLDSFTYIYPRIFYSTPLPNLRCFDSILFPSAILFISRSKLKKNRVYFQTWKNECFLSYTVLLPDQCCPVLLSAYLSHPAIPSRKFVLFLPSCNLPRYPRIILNNHCSIFQVCTSAFQNIYILIKI